MKKHAVIDLGSNTFQMAIVEKTDTQWQTITSKSTATKLAEGGLQNRLISEAAMERGLNGLIDFVQMAQNHGVVLEDIHCVGTSALRCATNGKDFAMKVKEKLGVNIEIISGDQEALLIHTGVKAAVHFDHRNHLIMDIGGGSVEFILCNDQQLFWRQSFEIGGHRLMELFLKTDPLPYSSQNRMFEYFTEQLRDLANACHQYHPDVLVGSAGTFETLAEMEAARNGIEEPWQSTNHRSVSLESFGRSAEQILSKNLEQRLMIPGMSPLRAAMIPVGIVLVSYILKSYQITDMVVSKYSLKEGYIQSIVS